MKTQNEPTEQHFLMISQAMVASIILGKDFFEHMESYRMYGPESVEESLGDLLFPFQLEMSLVEDITYTLCDPKGCDHCLLVSSIEIDSPFVRRRHYRIAEFLIEKWGEISIMAEKLANAKKVKTLFTDEIYKTSFTKDLESLNMDEFEFEDDPLPIFSKKEVKVLN